MNWSSQAQQVGRGQSLPAVIMMLVVIVVFVASSAMAQYQVRKPTSPAKQQATISITDPSGSTTWEKGKRYTIRWTSQGTITSVQIELVDQAGNSHDIVRRTTNSGSHAYSVARTLADGAYRLTISSSDGKVTAESSGTITIQPATLGGTSTTSTETTRTPKGGYTPRTTTPTGPSHAPSAGEVTTATDDNQPSGTPTLRQSEMTTATHQVEQEAVQLAQPVDVSGFIYPDLEIVEVVYAKPLDHQVLLRVRNNGLTYVGPVDVKVIATVGAYGANFAFDNTVTLQVDLQPGDRHLHAIPGFTWPDPIDHPQLTFGLNLDPQNLITEQDETNNRLDATVRIACGLRIDSIVPNSMPYRDQSYSMDVDLFGSFGREQYGKVVQMERNGEVTLPGVGYWSESKVRITIPRGMKAGTHVIKVYCSDPTNGPADASNGVMFTKKAKSRSEKFLNVLKEMHFFFRPRYSPKLDACAIAEALAEEFGDWLDFGCLPPEIDSVRVNRIDDGQDLHVFAWYTSTCPCVIVHEVWKGDQLIKVWPVGMDGESSQREAHQVFPALEPGIYQYVFQVVDIEEEEASANASFEHK